jgi:hypothetical protein
MERSRTVTDLVRLQDIRNAERAVVEAARAWLEVDRKYKGSNAGGRLGMAQNQLADAVDALERAEGK